MPLIQAFPTMLVRALAPRTLLLATAALLLPLVAHAQTPPAGQFPPVAPSPAPAARPATPAAQPQSFVLVAMTGDDGVDQFLRATADELHTRLAARGFQDVDPARVSQGIAADPSAISTLRARLGAACMVRVDIASRTADRVTLSIVVQTDQGEKTAAVYAAPSDIPAKVLEAVEPLLPAGVAPPAPAQAQADTGLDRVLLVDGTAIDCRIVAVQPGDSVGIRTPDGQPRVIPWAQIAQLMPNAAGKPSGWSWAKGGKEPPAEPIAPGAWDKRGGPRVSFDVQAEIVGMLVDLEHQYKIEYSDGQKMHFTGESPSGGGGGALGFHVGFMQLIMPDPQQGNTLWAINAGTGLDVGAVAFGYRSDSLNIVGQRTPTGASTPDQHEGGETKWASAYVVHIPLYLGGQVGLGHFDGGRLWQGVLFGLDWRPTYTYAKPGDLGSVSSFNYAGFGAHLDVGSLQADRDTPEANFRLSATYLPKLDNDASYASLGFGAVWY